jgi:PKD domain
MISVRFRIQPFPHIISRNLTPDKTGLPGGGHSLQEFMQIIRTGIDMDHIHPTCAGKPDGKCIPPPFNGDLLQIMPWPYSQMTDHDLQAIYEYLSAIPCVEGGPGEPANRCGSSVTTTASAAPKNATVIARQIQLDGTKSISGNGGPLTYLWTIPRGSPSAAILAGATATPTAQFGLARGTYTFQLTVTDSTGTSATDFATVNFQGN